MKNTKGHGRDPSQTPVYYCECGDHAFGRLRPWGTTLVSPQDAEILASRTWILRRDGRNLYAYSTNKMDRRALHRVINNTPTGMDTDHINGNGLDNRRGSLRSATRTQNNLNRHSPSKSASGFRGVTFHNKTKKWRAYFRHNGKEISGGYHPSAEMAAKARDMLVHKLAPNEKVQLNYE